MTQPSMAKTPKAPVVSAAQIRMLVLSMESMSVAMPPFWRQPNR
jgi:hypothetical protein